MAKLDVSTRTIQVNNFDLHYSADDFVNADSYSTDHRMNKAWVIHNCGCVLAIVFAEYYAYCDQDALDEACDRGKLDSLQVSDVELKDYETGEVSPEGYPEYEGIINLGNASEPFDSQGLDYFTVSADLFALDPVIMAVVETQSREQAAENMQDVAKLAEYPEGYDQVNHVIAYLNNEADYILMRDRENAAQGEWIVTCTTCGVLTQSQKREPVICPKCYGIDFATGPLVQTAPLTVIESTGTVNDFADGPAE